VYWGNPQRNGTGGLTFDSPVEISCRWDEKQELKIGYDHNKFSSQAVVLVNQDLDRRGFLCNSSLSDLQTEATANGWDIDNPLEIPTAFIIQQFEKIPMVRSNNDFVRTAYLYDQG
jgi:hypothetical protein